jgi:hypothetical protein
MRGSKGATRGQRHRSGARGGHGQRQCKCHHEKRRSDQSSALRIIASDLMATNRAKLSHCLRLSTGQALQLRSVAPLDSIDAQSSPGWFQQRLELPSCMQWAAVRIQICYGPDEPARYLVGAWTVIKKLRAGSLLSPVSNST